MKYIIFDFDGTLADIKSLMLEIGNEITARHGWPQIDEATYQKLRKGNIRDGLKHLQIPYREIPFAVFEGKRKLIKRSDEINFFPGIHEVIDNLIANGDQIFVLSTNSRKLIQKVLARQNLSDKLIVLPSSGLFGKASSLKKFMRKYNANKNDVWLIGDELRDIEAGKLAGVKVIAVTWGLQHPDTLKAAKPTFVANKPADITSHIMNHDA